MSEATAVATNRMTWVDLGTKNMDAAKRFYTELFGWTAFQVPDPDYGGYTVFQLDGKAVGGVMDLSDNPAPPNWLPYISVADVRAAAERARQAGGEFIVEPMDVKTAGSMSVIKDATGAAVGLWQPGDNKGWEAHGQARAVCWNELHTNNPAGATRFYSDVFGWEPEVQSVPGFEYTTFKRDGGDGFAGMMQLQAGEPVSYWLTYIAVDDCDATAAKVKALGGTVIVEPQDIPDVGRFAVALDTEGAVFGLLQPLPRA